jgi:hypothetical protein
MTTHARSVLGLALLVACAGSASAYAPASLTLGEAKCQQTTSKAVGKAWTSMTKCQTRCDAGALAGKNAASDCQYPWGGATLACIQKAKAKTSGLITRRCTDNCPPCYDSGGNCDAASNLDQWVAKEHNGNRPADGVEIFVSFGYEAFACTDENTLTLSERKCRDTVPVLAAKHTAAFLRCLTRCRGAQVKGALPIDPDPCIPPGAEPDTAACYQAARDKFEAKCGNACADPPDCGGLVCYGGSNVGNPCTTTAECPESFCQGPTFQHCFDWSGNAEFTAFYYNAIPAPFPTEGESLIFCPASPGGAFLDE